MEMDYLNNLSYMLCNGMDYIKYMMYNLMQRNEELEFNNGVLQRMVYKYTTIHEELVNENKSLREQLNKNQETKEEDKKPPLLPLPTSQL